MRLLFVADGRSPIALNWIEYFTGRGHEVHLASTFACAPLPGLASFSVVPVAFSQTKPNHGVHQPEAKPGRSALRRVLWGAWGIGLRTWLRHWLGPLTLKNAATPLYDLVRRIQPDLVHAMRIPFEGMLVSTALKSLTNVPLLVSVWGNDFTLHALASPLMASFTRQTLRRVDAVHTDCHRDRRLAGDWGFDSKKPAIVLPGGGGVQLDIFYPGNLPEAGGDQLPTIINPRGFRAYVRNDTFFKAIPLVLDRCASARFVCPSMAGEAQAQRWVRERGIAGSVELLDRLPRHQMAELFRRSQVFVSPSTHDGTPNTLLEAMACACFPVVGDIESLREWITHGVNGFLVDPGDPKALAGAILEALENRELRAQAAQTNAHLIKERAEYGRVMTEAEAFYLQLASSRG